MARVKKHIRLTSPTFYYTFAAHPAAVCVNGGGALSVACPDSDNFQADGVPLPESRRQSPSGGSAPFPGNPLAGPVAVDGAMPGDSIAVRIDALRLDRATGRTLLAPAHGLVPGDWLTHGESVVPRQMLEWTIDLNTGVARLRNPIGEDPIAVPLNPFVGCAGVAPANAQAISSLLAGDFGGNMDLPFVAAGAVLILPVFAPGALFMLGDVHAAQGHGEIMGGGIETSGDVDFTLQLRKGDALPFPRAIHAGLLYAIASHGDMRQGIQAACARLIDWLAGEFEMDRFDAYATLTHTNTIVHGNAVTPPYTVAVGVPVVALPPRVQKLVEKSVGS